MIRATLVLGAVHGLVGLVAAALGAHALEGRLEPEDLERVALAAQIGATQAAAILALAALAQRPAASSEGGRPARAFALAGLVIGLGALVFCGALYGLALTGTSAFAHVAPFGGLAMMAGWALAIASGIAWRR